MSRIRVGQDLSDSDVVETHWICDGATQWETTVPYISSRNYNCMIDDPTTNFKQRSAAGEIILTGMSHEILSYSSGAICSTVDAVAGETVCDGYNAAQQSLINFTPFLPNDSELFGEEFDKFSTEQGQAVAKAFANVDQSEMLAMATAGELPETVRWIAGILRKVIKAARTLRRGIWKLMRKALSRKFTRKVRDSKIDQLWLEFRYAVRPLFFDAVSLMKAFEACIEKGARFTARGFTDVTSSESVNHDADTTYLIKRITVSKKYKYSARAGVLYSVDPEVNGILSTFGMDQPLEVIWELTPFSFILDWLFNIGDLISAWSKNASLTVLGAWVVETLQVDESYDRFAFEMKEDISPYDSLVQAVDGSPNTKCQRILKRRVIDPTRPLFPSISINLDVAKLMDLAFIGKGILSSIRR